MSIKIFTLFFHLLVWYVLWTSCNVVLVFQVLAIDATKRAHANQEPSMDVDEAIIIIQGIFAVLFTFELSIRWAAEGLKEFWMSNDVGWNVLDAICCVIGVLDVTVELVSRHNVSDEPNPLRGVTVLRVLRIVRIVRVIRVIRIMKFFRELRMMIFSTLSSLQSVAWRSELEEFLDMFQIDINPGNLT